MSKKIDPDLTPNYCDVYLRFVAHLQKGSTLSQIRIFSPEARQFAAGIASNGIFRGICIALITAGVITIVQRDEQIDIAQNEGISERRIAAHDASIQIPQAISASGQIAGPISQPIHGASAAPGQIRRISIPINSTPDAIRTPSSSIRLISSDQINPRIAQRDIGISASSKAIDRSGPSITLVSNAIQSPDAIRPIIRIESPDGRTISPDAIIQQIGADIESGIIPIEITYNGGIIFSGAIQIGHTIE